LSGILALWNKSYEKIPLQIAITISANDDNIAKILSITSLLSSLVVAALLRLSLKILTAENNML
jgi:hypothetical protein